MGNTSSSGTSNSKMMQAFLNNRAKQANPAGGNSETSNSFSNSINNQKNGSDSKMMRAFKVGRLRPKAVQAYDFSDNYEEDSAGMEKYAADVSSWGKYLDELKVDLDSLEKQYRQTRSETDYALYEASVDNYNQAVDKARAARDQYDKDYKTYQDKYAGQILLHSGRDYSDYSRDELDLAISTKQQEYDAFKTKWGEDALKELEAVKTKRQGLTSAGADEYDVEAVNAAEAALMSKLAIDKDTYDRMAYDAVRLEQELNQLKYQQEVMKSYEPLKNFDDETIDAFKTAAKITNRQSLKFDDAIRDLKRLTGMEKPEIVKLLDEGSYYLNAENAEAVRAEAEKAAEKNPGLETAKSVARQTTSGMAGTVDFLMQKAKNPDKVLDINAPHQLPGQTNTAVRGKVAEDIASGDTTMFLGLIPNPTNAEDRPEGPRGLVSYKDVNMPDWLGGQNVGSMIYQAGVSGLDSAVNAAISRGVGMAFGSMGPAAQKMAQGAVMNAMMGSNVARDTTTDLIKQGVADDKALAAGLLSGAIEGLTEAIGADKVFDIWAAQDLSKWKSVLRAAVTSTAPEGLEEWMSNILNRAVVEPIYNGGISHFKTLYFENIDAGLSEDEALKKAVIDLVGEDTSAILSGMISSAPMGGVAATSAYSKAKADEAVKAAKPVSPVEAKYNEVSAANPDKTVMHPIATELTEAGYPDAKKAIKQGEILEKVFSGETITDDELNALDMNDPAVRAVFAQRSGLSGVTDVADLTRQLKRGFVDQAAADVRKLKATKEAAGTTAQQIVEQRKEATKGLFGARKANKANRAAQAEAATRENMARLQAEREAAERREAEKVYPYRAELEREGEPPLGDKKPATVKAEPVKTAEVQTGAMPDTTGRSLSEVESIVHDVTQQDVPSIENFVSLHFKGGQITKDLTALVNALGAYEEMMLSRGFSMEQTGAIINAFSEALTSGNVGATMNATKTEEDTNGQKGRVRSGGGAGERSSGSPDSGGNRRAEQERLEGPGMGRGVRSEVSSEGDTGRRGRGGLTSSKALGLPHGTNTENLYELNTEEIQQRPDLQKILNRAARYRGGVKIHFLTGGAIYMDNVPDGKYARAFFNKATGEIFVLVDADVPAGQLVAHEMIHHFMELTGYSRGRSRLRTAIAKAIEENGLSEIVDNAVPAYKAAYGAAYGRRKNAYFDEIIADAFAGLNPFGIEGMDSLTSLVRETINTDKVQSWIKEEAEAKYSLADVPDTWGRTLEELTGARDEGKVRERIAATPKATDDLTEEEWARRHESRREAEIDRELERREKQKRGSSEDRVKPEVKQERAKAVLKAAADRDQESDMHLKDLTAEERESRGAAQIEAYEKYNKAWLASEAARLADEAAASVSAENIQKMLSRLQGMSPEEQTAAIQRFLTANEAEKKAEKEAEAARASARAEAKRAEAAAKREAEDAALADIRAKRGAEDAKWADYEARHRREEVVETLTEEEKQARRDEYARKRQEAYERREELLKQEQAEHATKLETEIGEAEAELAKLKKVKEDKDVPYAESVLQQSLVELNRTLAENYFWLARYDGNNPEYFSKAKEHYEKLQTLLTAARSSLGGSVSELGETMYRETEIYDHSDGAGRDTENIDEDIYAEREQPKTQNMAQWRQDVSDALDEVKRTLPFVKKQLALSSAKAEAAELAAEAEKKDGAIRWKRGATMGNVAVRMWRDSSKRGAFRDEKGNIINLAPNSEIYTNRDAFRGEELAAFNRAPYAQKVYAYMRAFGAPNIKNERTGKANGLWEIAKAIMEKESLKGVPPERLAFILSNAEGLTKDGIKLRNPAQNTSYSHNLTQIVEAARNSKWFEENGISDLSTVKGSELFTGRAYAGARLHLTASNGNRVKEAYYKLLGEDMETEKRLAAEAKANEEKSGTLLEDESFETDPEAAEVERAIRAEQNKFSIDNYRRVTFNPKLDAKDVDRRIRYDSNMTATNKDEEAFLRDTIANPQKYIKVFPAFVAPNGLDWFKQGTKGKKSRAELFETDAETGASGVSGFNSEDLKSISYVTNAQEARAAAITGIDEDTAALTDLGDMETKMSRAADETMSSASYEDYKTAVQDLTDVFTALEVANAELFFGKGSSPVKAKAALNMLLKDSDGKSLAFTNADVSLMDTVASILRTELNTVADEKTPHIDMVETVVLAHELLDRDIPAWLSDAREGKLPAEADEIKKTVRSKNYKKYESAVRDLTKVFAAIEDSGVQLTLSDDGNPVSAKTAIDMLFRDRNRRLLNFSNTDVAAVKAVTTALRAKFNAASAEDTPRISVADAVRLAHKALGRNTPDSQIATYDGKLVPGSLQTLDDYSEEETDPNAGATAVKDMVGVEYTIYQPGWNKPRTGKSEGTQKQEKKAAAKKYGSFEASVLNTKLSSDSVAVRTLQSLGHRVLDANGLTDIGEDLAAVTDAAKARGIDDVALAYAIHDMDANRKAGGSVPKSVLLDNATALTKLLNTKGVSSETIEALSKLGYRMTADGGLTGVSRVLEYVAPFAADMGISNEALVEAIDMATKEKAKGVTMTGNDLLRNAKFLDEANKEIEAKRRRAFERDEKRIGHGRDRRLSEYIARQDYEREYDRRVAEDAKKRKNTQKAEKVPSWLEDDSVVYSIAKDGTVTTDDDFDFDQYLAYANENPDSRFEPRQRELAEVREKLEDGIPVEHEMRISGGEVTVFMHHDNATGSVVIDYSFSPYGSENKTIETQRRKTVSGIDEAIQVLKKEYEHYDNIDNDSFGLTVHSDSDQLLEQLAQFEPEHTEDSRSPRTEGAQSRNRSEHSPSLVNRPMRYHDPYYMDYNADLDKLSKEEQERDIRGEVRARVQLTREAFDSLSPALQAAWLRFDQAFGDGSFTDMFRTVEQAEHQLEREAKAKVDAMPASEDTTNDKMEAARQAAAKKEKLRKLNRVTMNSNSKTFRVYDDVARWQKADREADKYKDPRDRAQGTKVDPDDYINAAVDAVYEASQGTLNTIQWVRGILDSEHLKTAKQFSAKLRDMAKQVRLANTMAAQKGRRTAYHRSKWDSEETKPIRGKKKLAGPIQKTALEKAENAVNVVRRMITSDTASIEDVTRLQGRIDNADTFVTMARNAPHTATYFMESMLLDRSGGKIIGTSGVDVLLCTDENGNHDPEKQRIYDLSLFIRHHIDRMSLVDKARKAVYDFEAKYPYLVGYTKDNEGRREFGVQLSKGDEIAWTYKRLMEKALKTENKPVLNREVEGEPGMVEALPVEEAKAMLEALVKENPWVEDKANRYYAWFDTFMREHVVGGSLTLEQYEAMHAIYPHYVPTYRVFENGPKSGGSSSFSFGSRISDTKSNKKAVGSLRELRPVYDQVADLVLRYVQQDRSRMLHTNLLMEAMFDAEGRFSKYMQFDWETGIQAELLADDSDYFNFVSGEDFDAILGKATDFASKTGSSTFERNPNLQYTMTTWLNGRKYTMYINEGLFRGLESLSSKGNPEWVKAITKIGSALTSVHKAAVTSLRPTFSPFNLLRDLPSAAVYSVAGLRFGKFLVDAVAQMNANSDAWQSFQALGGTRNGYYWSEAGFLAEYTKHKGKAAKAWQVATFLGEHSEAVTRFAEYLAGLEKYGNTPAGRVAALKAAAEVTVDFSRGGAVTKVMNKWVPFLNPNVQGLSKMIRAVVMHPKADATFKEILAHTGKTLGRAVVVHTLVDGLLWGLRYAVGRDEDWDELSDYEKDNYYCIPIPGKPGEFLKIPKNREWSAILGTPMVRLLEAATGEDEAFDGYLKDVLLQNLTVSDVFTENLISSFAIALKTNEDYMGSAIVPYEYEEADKAMQFNAETSWAAVTLGNIFKEVLSPMQVDYLLNAYFGDFIDTVVFDCAPWGLISEDDTVAPFGEVIKIVENIVGGAWEEITTPFIADTRYSNHYIGEYYDLLDEINISISNYNVVIGGSPGETESYLAVQLGRNNEYVKQVHELNQRITEAKALGQDNDVARLTEQVRCLAMTAMGAEDEKIKEQKILSAFNTTGGYAAMIRDVGAEIKAATDEETIRGLKAQQAALAAEAIDFYKRCMSCQIRDPLAYTRGLKYGETVAEAFSDLSTYTEEFNFEPSKPDTQKVADQSSRLRKYELTEEQKDRHEEIFEEQYNKLVNDTVSSYAFKSATDRGRAQLMLDAKNDAKEKALEILTDEVNRSGAIPKFDEDYAGYSTALLDELVRLDAYQDNSRLSFMPTAQAQNTYVDPDNDKYEWVMDEQSKEVYYQRFHLIYETEMMKVISSAKYQTLTDEQKAAWLHDTKDNNKKGISTLTRLNTIEWMKKHGYKPRLRDTKAKY